jgi:tape measure domain-containing protein
MATETIQIVVTQSGAVSVRKDIEGVGDGAKSAESGVSALTGALTGLISVGTVAYLASLASAYTDLKSRVDLASGGVEVGNAVMDRLNDIAARTYSSLEQTTEGYIRNRDALTGLGFSINDTLNYTEALNDALVVSGAKGDVAASTANALSKAMSLGKLSGEELRTVLSNGGRVAELLAQQLNVSRNSLYEMGAQGKITGDVISKALIGNLETLRKEADAMPATIIDGVNRIKLAFQVLVGTFDQASGVSGQLGLALVFLANHMDIVLLALSPLAAALTLFAVQTILSTALGAITGLATGLAGLAVTIVETVIPAIVSAIAAVASYAISLITVGIPATVAFVLSLSGITLTIVATIAVVGALVLAFTGGFDKIGKAFDDLQEKFGSFEKLGKFVSDTFQIDLTGKGLADAVAKALAKAGDDAAAKMKQGVIDGGKGAATELKTGSAEWANAIYQALNGVPQQIQGAVKAGSDYFYNQATGAVEKSTDTGAKSLHDGVVTGSQSGAQIMAAAISGAGASAANEIKIAAAQAAASAAASYSGNSVDLGLGFIPGTSGSLGPWQNYSLGNRSNGTRGSNLSAAIQASIKPGGTITNSTVSETGGSPVTIINSVDPSMSLQAINSSTGDRTIVNSIKANSSEISSILGIS